MNNIFVLVMLVAVFVAACSQILLKRSANKKHANLIAEYMNLLVIGAYALFGVSTIAYMYVLRYIPMSFTVILESAGYVFVAILGWLFLGEKLNKRQLLGMGLIVLGIIIFGIN